MQQKWPILTKIDDQIYEFITGILLYILWYNFPPTQFIQINRLVLRKRLAIWKEDKDKKLTIFCVSKSIKYLNDCPFIFYNLILVAF